MRSNIESVLHFYTLCNRLKDTIRSGPLIWNIKRENVESVADHIYGTQMLAIAIYYQFNYEIDLKKVLYMLAIHELEEIELGDLVFYEIGEDEKRVKGRMACEKILDGMIGKETILSLLDEFNSKGTAEARFAYLCDKLECNIQIKMYEQDGCFDLNNQPNNPAINIPIVKKLFESEHSISNVWAEFYRDEYMEDSNFLAIIEYLKNNRI